MRSAPSLCFALALVACKDDPHARDRHVAPAGPKRSVLDQLAYEAEHRPGGKTADAVLAAFAKASLEVTDVKQLVAHTVDAKYCAGGMTAGLAIAVCEYESPTAASAAREHVTNAFPVPGRRIVMNGALTLTTTGPTSLDDVRARLEQVFAAM